MKVESFHNVYSNHQTRAATLDIEELRIYIVSLLINKKETNMNGMCEPHYPNQNDLVLSIPNDKYIHN